jgi:hypothetical protein
MREAAIAAGLVQSSRAGDTSWRDRLKIITEPEAAAVHCANLTNLHHLRPSQNFIVCDAGGGTVDLAVYKVLISFLGSPSILTRFCLAHRANVQFGNRGDVRTIRSQLW